MGDAVLAWVRFDVEESRKGVTIVALTPEALMAAKERDLPVMDVDLLLRSDQSLESIGLKSLNELHADLICVPKFWLEAYANVAFGIQVYQFIVWLHLLRELKDRLGVGARIVLPRLFLRGVAINDSFIYELARESLIVACRVVGREGLRFSGFEDEKSKSVRHLAFRLAARFLTPFTTILLRVRSKTNSAKNAVVTSRATNDILLVTQQYNDAVHAIPLARRLKTRFGEAFRWIGIKPKRHADLTAEEAGFVTDESLENLNFVDSHPINHEANKGWLISRLLDVVSAWEVAGVLAPRGGVSVKRRDWFELLIGAQYRGITSRAASWGGLLDAAQPKVIVGLSTLQDMALVRGWARRNNVPFVSLMHGAFPGLWRSHDADADYMGVFGKILAECPLGPTFVRPRRIVSCGPMQFADKARIGSVLVDSSPRERSDILFLGSFESLPFAPLTPMDQWRLIAEVHRACCEVGRVLRLRPHPRFPNVLSPYVDELARLHPGTICISRESSISRDLATCVFAIASHFDGAVIDSMFARTPVLSYFPEDKQLTEKQLILERTGGVIKGFADLIGALSVNCSDEMWVALVNTQQRFLLDYFDLGVDDSWARAIDLIGEAAHDAS